MELSSDMKKPRAQNNLQLIFLSLSHLSFSPPTSLLPHLTSFSSSLSFSYSPHFSSISLSPSHREAPFSLSPSHREDGNISSILIIAPEVTDNCTYQPTDIILLAAQHPNILSCGRKIPK